MNKICYHSAGDKYSPAAEGNLICITCNISSYSGRGRPQNVALVRRHLDLLAASSCHYSVPLYSTCPGLRHRYDCSVTSLLYCTFSGEELSLGPRPHRPRCHDKMRFSDLQRVLLPDGYCCFIVGLECPERLPRILVREAWVLADTDGCVPV